MLSLRINTNSTCNIDCEHCYYKHKVWFDGQTMKVEDVKDIILQAKNIYGNELKVIIMGWGEPLLYKHLFEVLEYSSITLNIDTSITTNFLLVNEVILKKFKELNILLNISLEWSEKYNDSIRWKWVFQKVIRNIFLANKIWNRCSINFTLTKNNILDIPFLVKLLSNKVEYITFSRYIPYIKNNNLSPLSASDYLIVEKILEKYKNNKLKYRQERFFSRKDTQLVSWPFVFDIKKINSLYVLPNKNIYPAWNLLDYPLGNLWDDSLINILNNWKLEALYNPENLNWEYCSTCYYKNSCVWDRWVAYFYTGNFWWDDVQCPYYKNNP